jgi:hypothetical protein
MSLRCEAFVNIASEFICRGSQDCEFKNKGAVRLCTVFTHRPTVLRNDHQTSNDATDTPTSTRNNSIIMTPNEEALTASELRKPGDDLVYQEYADWFGVNRVTLTQRHQGCQGS